jgi:DNA repair exonuclease SbcCD nuclease subunit
MTELRALKDKYDCPVVCAGDVFDRWNSSPELINWALDSLPEMFAVPGQHDLPLHQYQDLERSAYATLVKADKITTLPKGVGYKLCDSRIVLWGFPWGIDIPSDMSDQLDSDNVNIAVIHKYIWLLGHSYPNAPAEGKVSAQASSLKGFDIAVFGDNHKGFISEKAKRTIYNCGSFMRRKSDEIDYKPRVGLLTEDGDIIPYFLTSRKDDQYLTDLTTEKTSESQDMEAFIEGLGTLDSISFDFREIVQRYVNEKKPSKFVVQALLEAMENE